MVVDDEGELAEILARFLRVTAGHYCVTALDLRRAIDALAQYRPGLVLWDFRLPDRDGLRVINQARQTLPQTPVIIMTAYAIADSLRLDGQVQVRLTPA